MADGSDKLEFNGKFHIGDGEYVKSFVKCHIDDSEMLNEVKILRRLGRHDNVLGFLDVPGPPRAIKGSPINFKYYVAPFERAERTLDELRTFCFVDKRDCAFPKLQVVRSIAKQMINALKYFHNNHYTHGNLSKDAFRWTLVGTKISVKLCDFGLAQKHDLKLSDKIFRDEVKILGEIIHSLVYNDCNKEGRVMGTITGTRKLFDSMTAAMTNKITARIPSLEHVSTSIFLMSDEKRAEYLFQCELSLQTASVYVTEVCKTFTSPSFDRNKWKALLPSPMREYIEVDPDTTEEEQVALNRKLFKFTIDSDLVKKLSNERIPKEIELAFESTFVSHFSKGSFYNDNLTGSLRFLRNVLAHPYQVLPKAMISVGYSPATLVNTLIEKLPFFAVDVQRMVYILSHDQLECLKQYQGNELFVKEGDGCLFDVYESIQRKVRTSPQYRIFQGRVNAMIEKLNLEPKDFINNLVEAKVSSSSIETENTDEDKSESDDNK